MSGSCSEDTHLEDWGWVRIYINISLCKLWILRDLGGNPISLLIDAGCTGAAGGRGGWLQTDIDTKGGFVRRVVGVIGCGAERREEIRRVVVNV